MLTKGGLEPEYFHFDEGSDSFADSFYRRFKKVLCDIPIKNNYFLHLYLCGKYRSSDEVPDYLHHENYEIIKSRLDRIRIVIEDAKKWLGRQPESSIDAFSLSNICELMSLYDTEFLFREVLRTAKPNAGICFRNLMINREVPDSLKHQIVRDENLSKELLATDRSFVYGRVDAMKVLK
jgi:S-adenosylmethionine-diacylglycerol 3-amino-3-carboxypropyl transferase